MKRCLKLLKAGLAVAVVVGTAFCTSAPEQHRAPPHGRDQITNPASVYCSKVGGRATTEKRSSGSEFGVCQFDDNRQCGQWALFRGNCPIGGIRVSGFTSEASRFCAITGGTIGTMGSRQTCTTAQGTVCGTKAYFDGDCR